MVIIFLDFLMNDQIFVSPQVKRTVNISNKHGMYGLPHIFPNDLRPKILGNQDIPGISQNFLEL